MNILIKLPYRWQEPSFKVVYPEDCQKIMDVCKEHDLILTEREADYLWSNISEVFYAAGWLDEKLRNYLKVDIWSNIMKLLEMEKGKSVEFLDEMELEDISL